MCCLFGIMDCGHRLTGKERGRILSILSTACEVRGTDATGIAYNSGGKLRIYKRPLPAHKLRLRIPEDATVVMGHTRLATQGSENKRYNNHPWKGTVTLTTFALAHNGVLKNDRKLRKQLHLPETRIETDSYIAVQLLEHEKALNFDSLRTMAEKVEGSFMFSVLDDRNQLYFAKGDNPLCVYYFPDWSVYLYASTQEILDNALRKVHFPLGKPTQISLACGDMLKLSSDGVKTWDKFNTAYFDHRWIQERYLDYWPIRHTAGSSMTNSARPDLTTIEALYLEDLKSVATSFGYTPEDIDALIDQGFSTDEIEDALYYCGEF